MTEETVYYIKATVLQKNVIDAIKNAGFKHVAENLYKHRTAGIINVSSIHRWSDLVKVLTRKILKDDNINM